LLNSSVSSWLGVTFVLIGAINVWLVLQATARVKDGKASARLIAAHRIGGYLFIALFCVMGYFMVTRLGDVGSASSITTIHMTLAMVLSPLLFVKVLIARYYKNYHSFLTPIGLLIFVLSFVLIGITAGPSLARTAEMQTVSLQAINLPPASIDMNMAAETMEKRCTKCHNLDRIAGARKDARGWLATVSRMRNLPDSGISEDDSRIIVSYLASQMAPKGPETTTNLEVERAILDQRCGRCHNLDRVYKTTQTPEEWRATVARMVGYASGSAGAFQPGEEQQIIAYLSATQTPDAVFRRKALTNGGSRVALDAAAFPVPSAPINKSQARVIGFAAFVLLSLVTLVVRRPSRSRLAAAQADMPVPILSAPVKNDPLILRLASVTQQGSDARTLRFTVPEGRNLSFRPGQFLTFSFLFDGKKVVRSYSICSSAARSGYIEITAKRARQGCASVFLNDRATVGMTVEANGPFGRFCFDESKHRDIVLLAAGSGITPMMAMLRYMDDLCLETNATLLYCVRTEDDILFRSELQRLQSSLKNFGCHVLLSQPNAKWSGPRGHVSAEFIQGTVRNIGAQDFFLCGPASFMETSRTILMGLGVRPERIMQESFGSPISKSATPPSAAGAEVLVEFARSGKTCAIRSGQTLLELAEEQGVDIPSYCRQGQCGTCKTKLLEGTVRMDEEEGLDPDSRAQGFVLTCVGHVNGVVKLDA
jgi:ferredoxin-NADP reductase